jgi:hypothetical protein
MRFGIRLHRLWQLRAAVAVCFVLALAVSVWSVADVSLSPLGLHARLHQSASASVSVVVDTPESSMIDLRQDTGSIDVLRTRSTLLGTIIVTPSVRLAIAQRAGVPLETLEVLPPFSSIRPELPSKKVQTDGAQRVVEPNSITVRTSETVPLMEIFTRAESVRTAEKLADATISESQRYLAQVASAQRTPQKSQIRLLPLGRAEGSVIDEGVGWKTPILIFGFLFGIACASVIFFARVRNDWRLAVLSERTVEE